MRDHEPEDLPGREPMMLDEAGIDTVLHRKSVLITGAGGRTRIEPCQQGARSLRHIRRVLGAIKFPVP